MTTTADPALACAARATDDTLDGASLSDAPAFANPDDVTELKDIEGPTFGQRSAWWREALADVRWGNGVLWLNRTTPEDWPIHRRFRPAENDAARGHRALAARRLPGYTRNVNLSDMPSREIIEAREMLIAVAASGHLGAVWMSSPRSLGDDPSSADAFVRLLETGVRVLLPHHTDNGSSELQIERSPNEARER